MEVIWGWCCGVAALPGPLRVMGRLPERSFAEDRDRVCLPQQKAARAPQRQSAQQVSLAQIKAKESVPRFSD